ncbi:MULTISPECIES: dihydrolipoyl dehydrogenase [unclassified Streptomyces]|uniref:dihydrolipoyl dehydrogenase n=1 Tax=unclassified Streptomyces TaxID=2593676 RepID=UPI0038248F54
MTETTFDLVILGGGSGGYAAALRAADLGLSVALVEEDKLGGTCLHSGCIPTKALLHAAEVAEVSRHAASVGVRASFEGIDLPGLHAYRDSVVDRLYKGLRGLVASREVTLVHGHGHLVSPTAVRVGEVTFSATKAVVLATGSVARSLPGLDFGGRVLSSTEALSLPELPRSAIILGGGVIGVEFASLWRSFGVDVTVVEALPSLVPGEDPSCGKALERAFRRRGIAVRTGVRVEAVAQDESRVSVSLDAGAPLEADVLLVAVGRGPRTAGMGFEEAGVSLERGFVRVDESLRTQVPGVYAVGDIVEGLQLAHRGFQHGMFVAEEIAGLGPTPVADDCVPRVTYCDPEIASVGLTEARAKEKFGVDRVECVEYNLAGNGKSQIIGTSGFVKLVREKDGPVVGVHMVGARVGELIAEAQLAVAWEAHPDDVAPLTHAHPTQNEALGEAFLALAGKPLHAHG